MFEKDGHFHVNFILLGVGADPMLNPSISLRIRRYDHIVQNGFVLLAFFSFNSFSVKHIVSKKGPLEAIQEKFEKS